MNMHSSEKQPVLRDGELRLRPAKLPDDVPLAEPWYQDPEVMRLSEGDEDARYDTGMIEKMYRYLADQGELYIIELLKGEQWIQIGDVTLAPDTIPIAIGVAEYRSRGYGKRILTLLVDRARSLGWRQLKVKRVYTFNPRARRLYESLGFKQDGDVFHEDGLAGCGFVMQL
jgi:RimJ/RimL family protein N-acetyltransferase